MTEEKPPTSYNSRAEISGDWMATPGWYVLRTAHARARISLEAKGLLSVMASFSEDFEFTKSFLRRAGATEKKPTGIGINKLDSIVAELKAAGILQVVRAKNERGHYSGETTYRLMDVSAGQLQNHEKPAATADTGDPKPTDNMTPSLEQHNVSAGKDQNHENHDDGIDLDQHDVSAGQLQNHENHAHGFETQRKTNLKQDQKDLKEKNPPLPPRTDPYPPQELNAGERMEDTHMNPQNKTRHDHELADYVRYLHRRYNTTPDTCTHSGPHQAPHCPKARALAAIADCLSNGHTRVTVERALDSHPKGTIDHTSVKHPTLILSLRLEDIAHNAPKTARTAPTSDDELADALMGQKSGSDDLSGYAAMLATERAERASQAAMERAAARRPEPKPWKTEATADPAHRRSQIAALREQFAKKKVSDQPERSGLEALREATPFVHI